MDGPVEVDGRVRLSTIKLDIGSVTLGEMVQIEIESGRSFDQLLRGSASRRLLGLWLHEHRSSEPPRSWDELSSLRALGGSSSTSLSPSDGPSATSSD